MPRGDGTGPMGMGPMTGRAAGYCAGYPMPGFMNPGGGRFAWTGARYAVPVSTPLPAYTPGPYAYGAQPFFAGRGRGMAWGRGGGWGMGMAWRRGWARGSRGWR